MEEKYIPVCKGAGLYHSHKVEYSQETQKLVKRLLEESKLSVIQREKVKSVIKSGDPLPNPMTAKKKIKVDLSIHKPKSSKKRSKNSIVQSGAYERDKFQPVKNKAPYDAEKSRLQNLMAYGKDIPLKKLGNPKKKSKKNDNKEATKDEIFDNLVLEIEEREEFLEEMEELGEGKNYQDIIENEIAQKLKQLEMLDKSRFIEQTGAVEKYREKFKNINEQKSLILNGIYF